jgi:hypothetical protein
MKPSHKRLAVQIENIIAALGTEEKPLVVVDVAITADEIDAIAKRLPGNAGEQHRAQSLLIDAMWNKALAEHPGHRDSPILYLTRTFSARQPVHEG